MGGQTELPIGKLDIHTRWTNRVKDGFMALEVTSTLKVHDSHAIEAPRECLSEKGKRAQTRAAGEVQQRARRSEGD